jgi:hypothetical protein
MASPKATAAECRSARRHQVSYRLDVLFADGEAGCLLDLSASGLRVRFKHPLDIEAARSLRLEFPRWLELGTGLDVPGRFVWLRSVPGSGGSEAGFAFDGLTHKDENVLAVLIQRLNEALDEDRASAE